MKPLAIFLYDRTGIAAQPWAAAGIEAWCIDTAHKVRSVRTEGLVSYVYGDARCWRPPAGRKIIFVGAFPPCTHVARSGGQDFERKGGLMLRDALETFEQSRLVAAWSGARFFVENPKGILSTLSHIGPADYLFHPWQYAGYADDPFLDAYSKETCLWTGNGFVMPEPNPVDPVDGSKMWNIGERGGREADRIATPAGFSRAVFLANAPKEFLK